MQLFKDLTVRSGVKESPEVTLSRFRSGLRPYVQGKLLRYGHTDLYTTFCTTLEIEKHQIPRSKVPSCQTITICESSGESGLGTIVRPTLITPIDHFESPPELPDLVVDSPDESKVVPRTVPVTEGEADITDDCIDVEEIGYPSDLDEDFSPEESSPLPFGDTTTLSSLISMESSEDPETVDIPAESEVLPYAESLPIRDLGDEMLGLELVIFSPRHIVVPTSEESSPLPLVDVSESITESDLSEVSSEVIESPCGECSSDRE
ncbi:hypothetical protein KSP40_PGU000784 [Platanthera guangdongensis]|uniref:Uncharacterized protein n=1 Tax=Platanthera guangdongensis TaxID=2320717 RepID=A0ABR2MZS0_9ASPA